MKIALISDIHFGEYSRTEEFSVPGEPIEDKSVGGHSLENDLIALLKENSVEYLFIAGDMTSKGSPQEFYYCEKKIIEIAESVNVPLENIICGMGNHDIDRNISRLVDTSVSAEALPDVKELARERYQHISANAAQLNLRELVIPKNGVVPFSGYWVTDEFVVFVLNTSILCSHAQKIPHGKVCEQQLQWFDDVSKEFSEDQRTKIVLMHHHPMNYPYPSPSFDVSMIEEGSELVTIAGKNGIDIIMHGHRHHPTALTRLENGWKRPITFLCAGSLSVNAKHRDNGEIPNTIHIVDIKKESKDIVLYNYVFSSAEGWKPVDKSTPTVPLEKEMWLGKLFEDHEVEEALKPYESGTHLIEWESIAPALKFMSVENLNKKIRDYLPHQRVVGHFPDDVVIMPNQEG